MSENLSRQTIARYAVPFLFFVAVVCFLVLRGADLRTVGAALADTSLPCLLAGLLTAEVFHLAEGMNLRTMLVSFGYPVTFWQGMKYAYIGFFFSSVTPSSTGGQPAQLYAMKKDGIELAHGSLALLAELASFQIAVFFTELLAAAAVLWGRIRPTGELLVLAGLGFLMNLFFIAGLLSVLFSHRFKSRLLGFLQGMACRLPVKNKKKWQDRLDGSFRDFQECADLIRRRPVLMGKLLLVSLCQVVCWFSVPFLAYRAMGEDTAGYFQIFLLQTVLFMASSLLPFPGAEGISEYAFVRLFSQVYVRNPIEAATLVSRGISFYCLLAVSAVMAAVLWKLAAEAARARRSE